MGSRRLDWDIARERGMTIDQAGFDAAMEEQRKRSQDASKFWRRIEQRRLD